jgi:aryl-alcohol dehydrogenase-like predicted oxidoreductase
MSVSVLHLLLLVAVLQLALAWCAKNPRVSTVITGATRAEQIVENMKAIAVLPKLTDEVMQRIHDITDATIVV